MSISTPAHARQRSIARRILLLAVVFGLLADLAIDGPAPGINMLLLTAILLGSAWTVRRRERAPDPLDTWLPVTALVLAGSVALRADPFLVALDLAAAAACVAGSVVASSGLAVTRRSATVVATMAMLVLEALLIGPVRIVRATRPWRSDGPSRRGAQLAAMARGLAIALPIALVFVVLFASADPIFGRGLEQVLGFRLGLGDLPGRLVVVGALAWLAGGLLLVAAGGLERVDLASLGAAAHTAAIERRGLVMGRIEALVVLLVIDAIVGAFVVLQLAYLFGGADTLAVSGLTYSDYARRGYFELVAAALFAGSVLVLLDLSVAARPRAYLALAIGLVALILVVLASAALRLQLYQDAYGWTELRLYVAVSIVAMVAALATMAALLAADRIRWIGHGLAVIGLAALLALNVLAPAHLVAERNLARAIDPALVPTDGRATLDVAYLGVLPDDAIPAIVAALPHLAPDHAAAIEPYLLRRRIELARLPALTSPFAWNLGRERARAALATMP